ncbi:type VI secretion system ImpM family protein [Duganella sp. SG902]|nr:type VI secretion system ImpM family protein [Duganella sp. SG902]
MTKLLAVAALPAIAIVGVALNLRPVMAGVGPLLDQIGAATGLTNTQASLLTTIPVAVIGLCALLGRRLRAWFGERTGTTLGVALIALACLARLVWPSQTGLIVTAVLAGIGVALVQVLLPVFIKRRYAGGAGAMLGLYSTAIMGGAAIAAASSAPGADWLGLAGALGLWALPALIALPLWIAATRQPEPPARALGGDARRVAWWRRRRAWELLVFFGLGTGAYTLVLAWLPAYYTSLGWTPQEAGYLLGALTMTEVLAGLLVSAFAARFPDRRGPLVMVLALLVAGLACLVLAPLSLAWLASGLLGLGIGALFPLSLILTLDHLEDPQEAGELAAFVQGGGYLIASLMPLLAGLLRDSMADLAPAWVAMAVGGLVLAVMALRFSPASYAAMAPRAVGRRGAFTPVEVGYFGKLPSHGDFVKGSASPALMRELDGWLSKAMELMSGNARWQLAYDAVAPLHFAFVCPRRHHAIGGHLIASRDQFSRRYPFLVAGAMEVAEPDSFARNAPLVLTRLWRRLEALAVSVRDTGDAAGPLQALTEEPIALDLRVAAYDAAFEDFLEQQTLGALDAMLARTGYTGSTRQLLPALGMLLQPVLASGTGQLEKSLVLPLPEDPAYRNPVAALWLHLITPFLAHADVELALFVTRIERRPALVLGFAGLSAQTLLSVLDPQAGRAHHITFDELGWVEQQLAINHAAQTLSATLAHGDLSLKAALQAVGEAFWERMPAILR